MLIVILRAMAICALLVVIGAASFNFALSGGFDQLICAMISLLAVLGLLSMGASLGSMDRDGRRKLVHQSARKAVSPTAEDRR